MAGGTWTTQNKVRPGAYINVNGKGVPSKTDSTTGVVTLPLPLSFGPEEQVMEVSGTTDLTVLGYDLGSDKLLLLREALKKASKVLLYRVGGGNAATVTQEGGVAEASGDEGGGEDNGATPTAQGGAITVTAKYKGSRGNDISVVAKENVNVVGAFNVETFLAGQSIDVQTAKNIEELTSNRLVEFSGSGALSAFSLALEGGTDTAASVQDYMEYFEKIQVFDFNTMALPVEDEATKIAGVSFIKRMRDEEGKKCQLVIAGYAADSEAVINVKNGVILEDGTTISASQATAWVAGAAASAGVATSLTYKKYDGAVDVTQRYLNTEIIESLQKGEFLFTEKRGEAVIEQDINSFISFSSDKGKDFAKNRVLRVLDDIANNSRKTFEDNYIGKVNNDVDGRELFKADRIAYFDSLQAAGAITNFEADDVEVAAGEAKDAILLNVSIQPIDAMEKLYMTVYVQ